jgi:transcriptional regulator with XRE-family HTH domain
VGEERTGRNLGRTMKELREAKGLTHEVLAGRINFTLKKQIEDMLRGQGEDMRGAWHLRDRLLERVRVRPETVERWEKVGFGVQRGTRAALEFYLSPAFSALLKVLDANTSDMDKESSNDTLQPGDSVVRPIDDEGHAALRENATGEAEFLVVPDGFGGKFLKEVQDVTDADHKAIKTYLEEEAAFVEAESEKLIDNFVREQTINMDLEIESLLEGDGPGA